MARGSSRLWWLPGTLAAPAGVLSLITAGISGKVGLWVPIGVFWLLMAGIWFGRLRPANPPAGEGASDQKQA